MSTASLLREYSERSGRVPESALPDSSLARQIGQLALAGDPAAQSAYVAIAGYLAEGLANIFNILDPQAVFVSGGLWKGTRSSLPM